MASFPTRPVTSLPYVEFPVGEGNFDSNRNPISMIILHSEAGFKAGTRKLFSTPPALRTANGPSSAHYGVNLDGTLDHYLEEYLVAYHASNYPINQKSIGIETEDNAMPNTVQRTDAQYKTLIALVADICKFYNIYPDRSTIKRHNEIVATTCPGNLDIDRVINGAKLLLGLTPPTVIPPPVIPQGTPVVPPMDDPLRAGQFLSEAIKSPAILSRYGGQFGNAEGAAREMVASWPEYLQLITAKKQAPSLLSALAKLLGVS